MLFSREGDIGDKISLFVVPDGFSSIPRIRISSGGETLLVMEANEVRAVLVEHRRHESGRCGFLIDSSLIPDLAERCDLEVHDDETGVLIYRRPRPKDIPRRVFRLETGLFPLWRLDNALLPGFQHGALAIERYGLETTTQHFVLREIDSVYLSGRVHYRNFAHLVENRFEVFAAIMDPFEQMAERLLILRRAQSLRGINLSNRDLSYFKPTISFAQSLDFSDFRQLKRSLGRMSIEVAATLADPLVRQLTTMVPTDMPEGGGVAAALDALSTFAFVGLRRMPEDFVNRVTELFGGEEGSIPPLPAFGAIEKFAAMLRESQLVGGLIERDQELYYYVTESFRRLGNSDGALLTVA